MNDRQDSSQYRCLVASRSLVKLLIDPDSGRVLDASEAAAAFYGLTREDLRQRCVWDLTPCRGRADTLALLAEIASGREPQVRPGSRHRRHDGELREVIVYPDLVEFDGRVLILATVIDVTEPRQTEERLRLALDGAGMGTWHWDLVTNEAIWSDMCCVLFGVPPGTPASWDRFIAAMLPDYREAGDRIVRRALEEHGDYTHEYPIRWPDGSRHWIRAKGRFYYAADGTPLTMQGVVQDITEHKERELALRRYRQIVEVSSEKLVMLDRDLRYQVVNPAYAALFGLTPSDLHGRAMAEVVPPETWTLVRPHLEAALAGEPRRFQFQASYGDGQTRCFEAQEQPFWQDGEVHDIVASLHDLTEIRSAQAALESERAHLERRVAERTAELKTLADRLQLATEAAGMGVFELDLRSGEATWDARLRALYGLPAAADAPSFKTWLDWVAPSDRPPIEAAYERLQRGEDTGYEGVSRVRCPDGRERHIALRARLRAEPDGAPNHVVGVNWDLTAEREAALALAASEARARAVLDASPVPLAIAHETGPVRYLNAAFVETFGYSLDDIPTWLDWRRQAIPDPGERARVARIRQELLAQARRDGGACQPLEIAVRCKDGSIRTVMARAAHLEGEERLNTLYDITELKDARDAAEQATRAKSEFLAHMSHEIRTPLNGVLGLAQVLERTTSDPDQRLMLAQIRAAGRSLLDILNDILDLSRIEAGRLPLDPRPFALSPLLAESEDLFGPAARAKGLAFTITAPALAGGGLVGDRLRVQQVLANLVGNAVKFTERGEVRLRVDALACTPDRVRLRFKVRDTGIGLTPEAQGRLFTPFTQADHGITRRFGGTGLGLAICKRLVEQMGGEIGAESRAGEGSTFWFELPFERAPEGLVLPPPGRVDTGSTGLRLAGLHLLVVDDSAANRLVAERMLRLEGARATLAEDGRQALERLRARLHGFDAVLMDVQMPVMDGLTATRLIRNEPGLAELPIIALTAGVLASQQEAALAAGMNAVLTKPLDLERMVALLSNRVRPAPAAVPGPPPDQPRGTRVERVPAERFPAIDGIDRASAAHTLAGNRALFLELLGRFAAEFAEVVAETRRDLAAGERETAARRMHTLKGNAGTLGARDLAVAAEWLEGAIAGGAAGLEERLAALDTGIAALIAASAPWQAAVTAAPAVSGPLDGERLKQLREALRMRDLAAIDGFESLRPGLCAALGEEDCAALGRAIHELKFPEALALLDQGQAHG